MVIYFYLPIYLLTEIFHNTKLCGCGGIGRHACLRSMCLTAWRFKFFHPHQAYKSYGSLKTLFILCWIAIIIATPLLTNLIRAWNVQMAYQTLGIFSVWSFLYITSTSSLFLILAKSVFFGKNSLSRPLLFFASPSLPSAIWICEIKVYV